MTSLERRIEVPEAAVFRLNAEVEALRQGSEDNGTLSPSSQRARQTVLKAVQEAIHAAGGEIALTTADIAASTGLHQTYVADIVHALAKDGLIEVSGRRNRIFRLPGRTSGQA